MSGDLQVMNVLALHGQRAALQQEQLCSETTGEPEAAAPATQTDRQTDIYRNHAVAAGHTSRVSWIRHLGRTWSSLAGCDTAGTHSRIK